MKIGTDIVNLKRIAKLLHGYDGKFANRILSKTELVQFNALNNERRRIEYLGGRFCAKEAIFKAAPNDVPVSWKSVAVESRNSKSGPRVYLNGLPWELMLISISHEDDYSIATAILTK